MSQITTLENLFGAPIQAIIKADYMAAMKTAEYIQQFGFDSSGFVSDGSVNNLGKLKETSFHYNQIAPGGGLEHREMKLPTLSLIPLPLLHVDRADFDFSVRVVDAADTHTMDSFESAGEPRQYDISATLVPQSNGSPSNANAPNLDANINVKVSVVQSDMPAGLSNLLALMGNNTQNIMLNTLQSEFPVIKLSGFMPRMSKLILKNSNGEPVSNVFVRSSYDKSFGIILGCHGKRWGSGEVMLTNENGEIAFAVARKNVENVKSGIRAPITFSTDDGISCVVDLYFE